MRAILQIVHWRALESHPNGSGTPTVEFNFSYLQSAAMQIAINISHSPAPLHTPGIVFPQVSSLLYLLFHTCVSTSFLYSHPVCRPHTPVFPEVQFQGYRDVELHGGMTALSLCSGKNQINRHFEEFRIRPYITRCVEVYRTNISAPGANRLSSLNRTV